MSEFINEHNTIFGIIFILIGSFFAIKNGKILIDELLEKKFILYTFTLKTFAFWIIIILGGYLLYTGHNRF